MFGIIKEYLLRLKISKEPFFVQNNFIGRVFTDSTYNASNTKREKIAIWKLARTLPLSFMLTNSWMDWYALNIPLNLLDKNLEDGDFDMILRMPLPAKNASMKEWPRLYKTFEVKTTKISKSGLVRSLKKLKGSIG